MTTRTLTVETIHKAGACYEGWKTFQESYGDVVEVTPEVFKEHAHKSDLDWNWAANHLLSSESYGKFLDQSRKLEDIYLARCKVLRNAYNEKWDNVSNEEYDNRADERSNDHIERQKKKQEAKADLDREQAKLFAMLYAEDGNHNPLDRVSKVTQDRRMRDSQSQEEYRDNEDFGETDD